MLFFGFKNRSEVKTSRNSFFSALSKHKTLSRSFMSSPSSSSSEIQNMQENSFVECLDTVNKWITAQVLKISSDDKMYFIHYVGWSSKWDEWITKDSPRLRPYKNYNTTPCLELTDYHAFDSLWLNNMEKYKCSICTCVVFEPINQPCAHIHCLSCLKKCCLDNNRSCPVCRMSFSKLRKNFPSQRNINTFIQHEIYQQTTKCQYAENGCAWSGQLGVNNQNYLAHYNACANCFVECKNCKQRVLLSSMEDHSNNNCVARFVACQHCQQDMKYSDYLEHLKIKESSQGGLSCKNCEMCPYKCITNGLITFLPRSQLTHHTTLMCSHRPVPCQMCSISLPFNHLVTHNYRECLCRPVECEHCQLILKLDELSSHNQTCSGKQSIDQ
jgi:hypothetical protein